MTKRILTLLAAIGGITVLVVAFAALYSLRGQAMGDLTRAQSPITGAQPARVEAEGRAKDAAGEAGEAAESDEPQEDFLVEVGGPFAAMAGARLDLVEEPGIVVSALVKDGAAAKAGVRRGDIVLAVDDQKVDDMRDLTRALKDKQAGDDISLTIRHGDAERKLGVTLGDQAGQAFLGILPCGPGGGMARAIRIAGPALRHGAFVESVVADGPAAKAGLKETDVITAVDGRPIDADNDLAALITAHKPGDTVVLSIDRRQESRGETGGEEGDATVTFEVKIEPVEVSVDLGESPDKAGAAYLGLRYHAGGPMMWHQALPGTPAMPALPMAPGEPMIAPLPPVPGDAGAESSNGDVFFFRHAPGDDGDAVSGGAVTFTHKLPDGEGDPKVELMFKAGPNVEVHPAPQSKDL